MDAPGVRLLDDVAVGHGENLEVRRLTQERCGHPGIIPGGAYCPTSLRSPGVRGWSTRSMEWATAWKALGGMLTSPHSG